jgi:threonine dehydratase
MGNLLALQDIEQASKNLEGVAKNTLLEKNFTLSEKYDCEVYLKREDLQQVRSYKIRGAYNKIFSLTKQERDKGVICASAGNHSQGFAFSCYKLGISGTVYMPSTTPKQKVEKVKMFGKEKVTIVLTGDTFDDANEEAKKHCDREGLTFVHPFDDELVMAGQGTVGKEIFESLSSIDYLFLPVGGGGLFGGVSSYYKQKSPKTKLIGVEPEGAPALQKALAAGKVVELEHIDKFVDGAAVKKVGLKTFAIIKETLDDLIMVPEGKTCSTILELYNQEAIVVEPAGSLTIASLDFYKEKIKGKTIVCVVSGSNNDIDRMAEIKERALVYEGLKHFFIVRFPQRPGALKQFVSEVLGPDDDITRFEFVKKNLRESGPAFIGVELKRREDYQGLLERMKQFGINYTLINEDPSLFEFFV